jgi:hypothetical protein
MLSSWDTFALEFEIQEYSNPDLTTPETERIDAEIKRLAGAADEPRALFEGEHAPEFSRLVTRIGEIQTSRVVNLTPSQGTYTSSVSDVGAAIYKNWIYLHSPECWSKQTQFAFPTIAEIQQGRLRLGGMEIAAWRGPQDGVYTVVSEMRHHGHEHPLGTHKCYRGMIGAGVYGYRDGEPDASPADLWTGMLPESVAWFQNKLRDEELPSAIIGIDLARGERFNQGDAFFTDEFGIDITTTPPGGGDTPIINDAPKS